MFSWPVIFSFSVGLVALATAPCSGQSLSHDQINAIDTAATRALADSGVPAASIAIVRDGKLVYSKAYGFQREGQPARTDARYSIGSVSKQFTASAILILADEGKLSLGDRVSKYLPDLTRANDVTIRQLLDHTAGYRDYWPQDYAFTDMKRETTPDEILNRWAKLPLDFEPGTRWQYSNTGYVAAGRIVEIVSGRSLASYLQTHVFARLGLRPVEIDSGLNDADPQGFTRDALGPIRAAQPVAANWSFAAGQFAMTAADLARWDISVINRSLMSDVAYKAQERETVLSNGVGTNYGLGVTVAYTNGHRVIAHGGGLVGFLTENRIYPDDHAAIVVANNADFGNAQISIADAIEQQLFANSSGVDRARMIYNMVRSGTLDRSIFTLNGNSYFSPEMTLKYHSSLAPLGEPKSVIQVQSDIRGGFTSEQFLFDLDSRKLGVSLRAEPGPKGKVEEFIVTPIN